MFTKKQRRAYEKECRGNAAYPSIELALIGISTERKQLQDTEWRDVYQCSFCNLWHRATIK